MRLLITVLAVTALSGCGYDWTLGPAPGDVDAGAAGDAASAVDASGNHATFPPSGLPACAAMSNTNSCDCASGTCSGTFLDPITMYCRSGATCQVQCPGGGCKVYCEGGATCDTSCSGGNCTVDCLSGAICNGACSGGSCTFICPPGASCNNTCSGSNCTTKTAE